MTGRPRTRNARKPRPQHSATPTSTGSWPRTPRRNRVVGGEGRRARCAGPLAVSVHTRFPPPPSAGMRNRDRPKVRRGRLRPPGLVGKVLGNRRPPPLPPLDQLTSYLLGPTGLTAQATGFDRRDLLQAICQALPAGTVIDRAALEALADRVLAEPRRRPARRPPEDGPRWTTTELLGVEQSRPRLRPRPDRDAGPRGAADELAAAMSGRTLSGEQRHMVEALAAADGLAVVVGPAGAGKTAALAAATRRVGRARTAGHWCRGRGGHRPPARARHRHRVHLA